MKDHNRHKHKGTLLGFIHQLMQIDLFRYLIARLRYLYYAGIKKRLKTFSQHSAHVASNTISHNLKGLNDYAAVRPLALIKPLSIIESLSKDSKILSIGPRSEGELLALVGYGFIRKNITALDLITYSPWVDIGDMHKMKYNDSYFDAAILGWVIAYSNTPQLAAKEVVRVVKPGAIIAVGVEYGGEEGKKQIEKLDYIPGAGRQTTHVDQILAYFDGHVDHVYFNHSIIPSRMHLKGSVIAIFSIKK